MCLFSVKWEAFTELLVSCHMHFLPESLRLLRSISWDAACGSARAGACSMQDPTTASGAWRELRTA